MSSQIGYTKFNNLSKNLQKNYKVSEYKLIMRKNFIEWRIYL